MERLTIILAALLNACSLDGIPIVYVDAEPVVEEIAVRAVETWSELGFVPVTEDPGLPECDRTWYSDWYEEECQITLRVSLVPGLTDDDAGGGEVKGKADHDTREVMINAKLIGTAQAHTMAHEIGHILLDSMHLDSYLEPNWEYDGIMRSSGSTDLTPTANDYALACHTIGVCVN